MITEKRVQDWKHQIETIIGSYDVQCLELNNWEVEFVDSIEMDLSSGKQLSFKQSSILRKIYDRIE